MDEMNHQLTSQLLDGLLISGLTGLVFIGMSYVSWRFLRHVPDIPDKPALVRGAKWGGVVMAGLFLLVNGVMWLAVRNGLIASGMSLAMAVLFGGMGVLDLRYPIEGEGMSSFRWPIRHGREHAVERWLEWREKKRGRHRGASVMLAVTPLLWLGMAVWGYCDVDRSFIAMLADERFGNSIARELGNPLVEEVMTMRSWLQGPSYPMHVRVPRTTKPEEARRLAEQIWQLLSARKEKYAWQIVVRPEHGPTLAKTLYVPPGMVLPPGIEKRHPQPRDW